MLCRQTNRLHRRYPSVPVTRRGRGRRLLLILLPLCVLLYALLLEPKWLEVTHHDKRAAGRSPVRVALLTDLHLDDIGHLERRVIEELQRAQPDVLVLGGDAGSWDIASAAALHGEAGAGVV